jgi:hypothetical protein
LLFLIFRLQAGTLGEYNKVYDKCNVKANIKLNPIKGVFPNIISAAEPKYLSDLLDKHTDINVFTT